MATTDNIVPLAAWERVGTCSFEHLDGTTTEGWISTWRLRVPGGWLYRTHERARDGQRFEPTETFVPTPRT
jgi:hypothetical protein